MRFSKEARIGLLVTISLLIFFAGFYFLKGANLFSGENEYYAYYDNVMGLQPSAAVQIKGLSVGRVSAIELTDSGKVKVTLAVSKKVLLPEGTSADLASADLLGTKVIALQLGPGGKAVPDESTIASGVEGGLLDNLSAEISPLIADVRKVVSTLDTVLMGVHEMMGPETRAKLSSSVASMDEMMKNLNALSAKLNRESEHMASIIRNTNSITENLADNNQQISNIIRNTNNISDQLASAPIQQAFKDLQGTTHEINTLIAKINSNQGSLGMMVNDKRLYENLAQSLKTLDLLMEDINKHPSRYINVTIFGRKNKDTH